MTRNYIFLFTGVKGWEYFFASRGVVHCARARDRSGQHDHSHWLDFSAVENI